MITEHVVVSRRMLGIIRRVAVSIRRIRVVVWLRNFGMRRMGSVKLAVLFRMLGSIMRWGVCWIVIRYSTVMGRGMIIALAIVRGGWFGMGFICCVGRYVPMGTLGITLYKVAT